MNNIAYCGLACCVCSQNDTCVGCQSGGCDVHGWCKNYNCCREKGLNGCWECSAFASESADFPCSGTMLDKPRIRAFARFAKEYGTNELTRCLLRNKENGIVYHYDGQHIGDYDKCETEEEIIEMIKTGQYVKIPYEIRMINIFGENRFETYTNTRVGCRGIVVRDNQILVTHELNTGWYLIPSGGMEHRETPEECCVREVHEETGFVVKPMSRFLKLNEYYEDWRFISYYFVCDICKIETQQLTQAEKERGLVPEWIEIDKLISMYAKYNDYYGINEEKRGSYQREYTALNEYLQMTKTGKIT